MSETPSTPTSVDEFIKPDLRHISEALDNILDAVAIIGTSVQRIVAIEATQIELQDTALEALAKIAAEAQTGGRA